MKENLPEKPRLKIAMIIDAYDECKNGAAISTKRFVTMLRGEHDVYLVTTGEPGPGKIVVPKFYPPFVSKVMKRMKTPLAIPVDRKLRKVIRDVDVIHVQFPFLLGIRSIKIARKLHIPVIATFHIQAEHLAMNAGIRAGWFIRGTYKVWMAYVYNQSQLVICPSKFAQDELKKYGLTSPSIVISNGILPAYKPMNSQRSPEWTEKFIILSVGRFAPEKRHKMIIDAINSSRHREKIQLILIGEGPRKEELQAYGKDLPNKTVFLTLQAEELIYYYNIADLYVHAASIEIEGMTILEAMGCGLPLLVADSPKSAAKQFALDERSLFNCSEIPDLVNKIDYWFENPDQLKQARKLYHENALKYRIESSYKKLVDEYVKVVDKSHQNRNYRKRMEANDVILQPEQTS
jgi:1,2-diacylglycerol 3-alpha-glucosyltransferase